MLNAQYFKSEFDGKSGRTGARGRADVYLHSGAMFEIEGIDVIHDGYIVFRTYPPRDADAAAKRDRGEPPRSGAAESATDLVVVAYEAISCLHFAPAVRQVGRSVGF